MIIGITDTLGSEHKFTLYLDWLKCSGIDVETVKLSYKLDNLDKLSLCDALVLTGGHDIDPALYHGPTHHPTIVDVDRKRDEFECKALERALHADLPVLGICRGLQLANVFFGGTLIPDIEEAGYQSHRAEKGAECRHNLTVEEHSLLFEIIGMKRGNVNSSHHQAALNVGKGLRVVARSDDGIIEAMEFENANAKPFFLLVQWHPERMNDVENSFSQSVLQKLLLSTQLAQH